MNKYLRVGLVLALSACSAFAAEDVAGAVVATVKTVDRGAKTVTVKTADGTEQTIRFVGRTVAHGAEATGKASKDAFLGMKEGDEVLVHYTEKGSVKTAEEVDHLGKEGLKASVVTVKSVDRGAKTVAVKTADGADETYHLTARAVREMGTGADKTGKATVYYTEEAGKKVAHFFSSN
jgi:hypothetical protein